jgi:hypothetical protein
VTRRRPAHGSPTETRAASAPRSESR